MKRRILRAASALVGAGAVAGTLWLWPAWVVVEDSSGRRGFFHCSTWDGPGYAEKNCLESDGGLVFQERRQPSGYAVRFWYEGEVEVAREMDRPGKPTITLRRGAMRTPEEIDEAEKGIAEFNAAAPTLAPWQRRREE